MGGGLGGWLTPPFPNSYATDVCVCGHVRSFLHISWGCMVFCTCRVQSMDVAENLLTTFKLFFCPSARGNEYDGFNHKRNVCHESYLSSFHILSLFSPLKKTDFTFFGKLPPTDATGPKAFLESFRFLKHARTHVRRSLHGLHRKLYEWLFILSLYPTLTQRNEVKRKFFPCTSKTAIIITRHLLCLGNPPSQGGLRRSRLVWHRSRHLWGFCWRAWALQSVQGMLEV